MRSYRLNGDTLVYDQLLITGEATLGGTLTVNLLDSFVPSPGQSFTLVTTDDGYGTFAIEMLPSVLALIFDVIYNPHSVVLLVSSGAYNQNGIIDAADYVVWRKHLGSGTALANDETPGIGTGRLHPLARPSGTSFLGA